MSNKFTFLDFMNQSNSSTALVPISAEAEKQLVELEGFKGRPKEIKEFKDSVNSDLTSPQTLGEISNLIGEPKPNETEDEFVKRSMAKLTDYVTTKFCK
ncbi:hypothetical protein E0H77_00610 [Acinetobacter sp. ANC 4633]|uniref:hypothetical protein n=1 Tax=Acinetobacter sp. ANC 4633 TaxID=2529845 RepID=UPI00103EB8D3|nr:hypothetical protein [Acinetobacter sp. ANC 4633]TCB28680.1 hypothetical protein E0H77_00610 [Acinetobacter sp. ANC 4633]